MKLSLSHDRRCPTIKGVAEVGNEALAVPMVKLVRSDCLRFPCRAGIGVGEGSFFFMRIESDVDFGCPVRVDFHYL